jgi:amino acid transporter
MTARGEGREGPDEGAERTGPPGEGAGGGAPALPSPYGGGGARRSPYARVRVSYEQVIRRLPQLKLDSMGEMERTLSVYDLTFLSIGAICGSGIFMIPGVAARIAGPESVFVWLSIGALAITISLCIAELASMFPNAGGVYTYCKEAFGPFIGFLAGWASWVTSWVTIAMVISAAVREYLDHIFHLGDARATAIALGCVWVLTFFNYLGVRLGAQIQRVFTVIILVVLGTIIMGGAPDIKLGHFLEFVEPDWALLLAAAAVIIDPFIGWEAVTFMGEEAKDPRRSVPTALVWGTVLIVMLYLSVVIVSLGVVPSRELGSSSAPIALVVERAGSLGPRAVPFLVMGTVLILLGCCNAWILSASRLPYALARDEMLPAFFARLHPTYKTPVNALVIQAVIASFLVAFANYEALIKALVPIALIMYGLIVLAVPVLRLRRPSAERPYKTPMFSLLALFSVLAVILILSQVDKVELLKGVSLVLVGVPIYFLLQLEYNERFVVAFNEMIAPFYDTLAKYAYPEWERAEYLRLAAVKRDDTVLDIACRTGLLVPELSKAARLVYATDVGFHDIEIAREHLALLRNVSYVRADAEFLPFADERFDKVVGFGLDEEVVSTDNLFREVKRVLKRNGRATVLVFEESFVVMTAPRQWKLAYLEDLLEDLGLSFRVKRVKVKWANAYAFVIRKTERQSVQKYQEEEYDSFYSGHRARAFHPGGADAAAAAPM